MNNPKLNGVRGKLDRANHHFKEIDAAVETALSMKDEANLVPPYEYQADRKHLIVTCPTPKPVDRALPLAIGDYIHNLRSALDHLIFQLAVLNGKAAEAETIISFPIFLSDPQFENFTKRKVAPFIDRQALADIKELQPYQTGNLGDENVLWVLSQLDIVDKHRLLVVIARQLRPTSFKIEVPSGESFEHRLPRSDWKPLEGGAEIIRFDLSGVLKAQGKVRVNLDTAAMAYLKDTGLFCDGREIRSVLTTFRKAITNIVDDIGRLFFGE
jgi:hypothetical protein